MVAIDGRAERLAEERQQAQYAEEQRLWDWSYPPVSRSWCDDERALLSFAWSTPIRSTVRPTIASEAPPPTRTKASNPARGRISRSRAGAKLIDHHPTGGKPEPARAGDVVLIWGWEVGRDRERVG
jgi:type II secretory pathway pseudopilin PulG